MILFIVAATVTAFSIFYKIGIDFQKQDDVKFYMNKRLECGVPERSKVVNYRSGDAAIRNGKNFIWSDGERLFFFPSEVLHDEEKQKYYNVREIPISYINGFQLEKPSEKSTLIDNILSDTGERVTVVDYYIKDVRYTMSFEENDYYTFIKLINNKENIDSNLDNAEVKNKKASNSIVIKDSYNRQRVSDTPALNKTDEKTIPNKIRELAKLQQEGVLSEQEFIQKKKELLDKI